MSGITNGLFAARSGLSSYGTGISVVGDNVANSGTIGYKKSRTEFADIVSGGQSSGKTIGSGSTISAIMPIQAQGTLEFTGRALDLGIDGEGYFVVEKNNIRSYTRAGNFKIDDEGFVVTQSGEHVLGFPANGNGSLERISVNSVSQGSIASQNVVVSGNLDAGADILTNGVADIPAVSAPNIIPRSTITYSELNDASAFSTVFNVSDSLGAPHTVTAHFYRTDADTYVARLYVNNEDVDGTATTTSGIPREIASINMDFDTVGSTTTPNVATATIPWDNASAASTIDFDFTNFTQFFTSSNIQSISDDGEGIGSVISLDIDSEGQIFTVLDSGSNQTIGKIGMANFANSEGLQRIGGNRLQETTASGSPIIGEASTGKFGTIESGNIELSTVDIAEEFTRMIVLQQAFSASSRVIRTISQLNTEITQLV